MPEGWILSEVPKSARARQEVFRRKLIFSRDIVDFEPSTFP